MADETPSNAASTRNTSSRVLSKKDANRAAAAKAYCVAMKKAGDDVPNGCRSWPSRPGDELGFVGRPVELPSPPAGRGRPCLINPVQSPLLLRQRYETRALAHFR